MSRAADTHLIIRPHVELGVAVLDAAVRSWPPVDRLAIRWEYPLWNLAEGVNPNALQRRLTAREKQYAADEAEAANHVIAKLIEHGCGTNRDLRRWTGRSPGRLERLLNRLEAAGRIVAAETTRKGNTCLEYKLAPAEDVVT